MMLKRLYRHFSENRLIYFVIFLGSLVWSLVLFRSGLRYSFGYGFWGPNGHDGIWHIALAQSLARGSLDNPIFAGEALKNYHLGFDLFLALINRVTNIPINYLYFQVVPVIFSLLIGSLVYIFVLLWRKSRKQAMWATIFVYFSGSFGFVVTMLREGIISGESVFWAQQSVSTLVNPPYALSLIFMLLGLIFLLKYLRFQYTKYYILSALFFGLLIQIKAYAAILVLCALFVSGLYSLIINHKSSIIRVFIFSLMLNLLLFLIFKTDAIGNVFIWQPFWFLETLMSYSDRLGWEKYYSAMTTYKMGGLWIKAGFAYGIAFIIFLIGNMGLRVLSIEFLVHRLSAKSKLDNISLFILGVLVPAVILPMFFVQSGTPWNTIQFFYYFLFFTSVLAGISFSRIIENLKPALRNLLYGLLLIFIMAGNWATLQHYLPPLPQAKISNEEIDGLKFLSNQPDGIVLIYPYDAVKAMNAKYSPRPLYLYESTAYVSAYTNKQVFLEDEVNANIMGYDWKNRREEVLGFISNLDPEKGKEFLKSNNINYLYLVKDATPLYGEQLKLGSSDLNMTKIFENSEAIIFLVD